MWRDGAALFCRFITKSMANPGSYPYLAVDRHNLPCTKTDPFMSLLFSANQFPLFQPKNTEDLKDPCPVFDGEIWHVFGSSGNVKQEKWSILHATAPDL